MNLVRLFAKAGLYHLRGHFSQPVNAFFSILGLVVNNVVFFTGVYLLLFQQSDFERMKYYYVLATMILLSSGTMNFLFSNLGLIGSYIEQGRLDEILAYPMHPLVYFSISRINIAFIGDVAQGLIMWGAASYYLGVVTGLKILALAFASFVAFVSVAIFAGSLSFYSSRGGTASQLLNEITLTFSVYPIHEVLTGRMGILKYLTPALITAVLPMQVFQTDFVANYPLVLALALMLLVLALSSFQYGRRFYLPASNMGSRQ